MSIKLDIETDLAFLQTCHERGIESYHSLKLAEALTRLKRIGDLTQEMWIGEDGDRSGTLNEILVLCGRREP